MAVATRVRAGMFRHKVQRMSRATVLDAAGQSTADYVVLDEPYASIEPLTGRELVEAKQVHEEVTHRVRFRWRDGVKTEQRIMFGTRIFEIVSVLNAMEQDKVLELMCKEVP